VLAKAFSFPVMFRVPKRGWNSASTVSGDPATASYGGDGHKGIGNSYVLIHLLDKKLMIITPRRCGGFPNIFRDSSEAGKKRWKLGDM
jgi:hypothetical protein